MGDQDIPINAKSPRVNPRGPAPTGHFQSNFYVMVQLPPTKVKREKGNTRAN